MDYDEQDINLSETDYEVCALAVLKCNLLWRAVKAGLTVTLTDKGGFGFVDMTDDEENTLLKKLYANSDLKWLKEQKNNEEKGGT